MFYPQLYYTTGVWGVGVATPLVRVDQVPLGGDAQSWVLTSEGATVHNAEAITKLKERPGEGDVVVRDVMSRG